MTFSNSTGLGVYTQYGNRDTGLVVGVEQSSDSVHQLSISFTGASLADGFIPPTTVPKGALFKEAILRVDEAFVVTGTTPTLIFGALTTEATNGIVISEAELENVGTKALASAGTGTWAFTSSTGTTATAKVGKTTGGTSPVIATTAGKATLTLKYYSKAKA